MIHVCYALYDTQGTYAKFIGASMQSVFANTREKVTVHLLCDATLNADNRRRFTELVNKNGGKLRLYDVTLPSEIFDALAGVSFSPATFYRMRIADILGNDVKKLVYLDADTIVNLDLKELYRYDLKGKTLAGVVDKEIANNTWREVPLIVGGYVAKERYFNAGVLLIDVDRLRARKNFFAECVNFWANNRNVLGYLDQDILNFFFKDDSEILPAKYNTFVFNAARATVYGEGYQPLKSAIYHYAGGQLGFDRNSPQDRLFWEHYCQTPWCDADFVMRALSLVYAVRDEQMEKELQLRRLLAQYKQRVFWGDAKYEAAIRRVGVFAANDVYLKCGAFDEHGIIDVNELRAQVAQCKRGEKITVVIFDYYRQLRGMFTRDGFVENEQYTDGRMLIPCRDGIKPQPDSDIIKNL